MRLNLTQKNIGLINRLLRLQLSELFRTLTQASRSLLLLKGWKIKEKEPFTGSTYETRFEPFSLKVYPYDSKRLRWTKKLLTSVQGMNPLQTYAKKFQLSASFKTTNPRSVFVGKVSAMLEIVVRKNNSSHDCEVILLIVTTTQLNLAEFCLSFKGKLKCAIPFKKEDFKKIQPVLIFCVLLWLEIS